MIYCMDIFIIPFLLGSIAQLCILFSCNTIEDLLHPLKNQD
jgi:uncharacterized protein (DUF3820 family)